MNPNQTNAMQTKTQDNTPWGASTHETSVAEVLEDIPQPFGLFKTFKEDWLGKLMGTGFHRFTTDIGVSGLAKHDGETLDILAVHSTHEGRGCFRQFIANAKEYFGRIVVRHDWNPIVGPALARYGFTEFQDGESCGWKWSRECSTVAGREG